jgi:diaminohydroxyphosphoribosylaminopyrimidine deaminase/5-amino-6-(5-phosphoribosylamino)uracil reductase
MTVRLAAADLPGVQSDDGVRQPLRVVLDTRLRMPPRARMLNLPGETLILCGEGAPADTEAELRIAGAEVLRLPQLGGRIDLPRVLAALAARTVNEVLVESGPTLAGALLQLGLVDELIVYQAPHLMGHAARELVRLPGIDRMADRLSFAYVDVRRVGADLRVSLRPCLRSGTD